MTEVLAGAVGGLVALLGAFGVQVMVIREQRAGRARALAAEFTSSVLAFYREFVRYDIQSGRIPTEVLEVWSRLHAVDTAATELKLLCSASTRSKIGGLQNAAGDLLSEKQPAPDSTQFSKARADVEMAIESEFGKKPRRRRRKDNPAD